MKKIIKKAIRSLGFDFQRFNPFSSPSSQLLAVLNHAQIDIVFDIGANVGQFAQELRSVGFPGNIVSFDPLITAHSQLCKASRNDSRWFIHPRTALGDYEGEIVINVAGNSVSSSILPMLDAHVSAATNSAYVASEPTPITKLDTVAKQYLSADSRLFIKIDTQGFEWQVLDGARDTFKRVQGVLLELSFVPLYEGQYLWLEIIERMEKEGFTIWSIQKGFTDLSTGRSLQMDAIFLRN